MAAQNFILRSVYLTPEMDTALRQQAFDENVSKNDLIRRYLDVAMRPMMDRQREAREEALMRARERANGAD